MKKIILMIGIFSFIAIFSFAADQKLDRKQIYELQERCSKSDDDYFKKHDHEYERMNYASHYNMKLNKCFILITGNGEESGLKMRQKDLNDVLENTLYGWFLGSSITDNLHCEIVGRICRSEAEWDSLVKPYMVE